MSFGFTFLNLVGRLASADQREDDLPTIRSHTMREVRRRKRLIQKASKSPDARLKSSLVVQDSARRSMPVPPTSPSGIILNKPLLDGIPDELERIVPDVRRYMHYFIHGFTASTFPTAHVRHECDILAVLLTLRDPALLHALSALSTVHRALINETHSSSEFSVTSEYRDMMELAFLYHKQCAIISLKKSLAAAPQTTNPSWQATIILLLTAESLHGDSFAASAHKSGLLKLVKMGAETEKSSHLMVSDAIMSDLKSAALSLTRPLIKLDDQWTDNFDKLKNLEFVPHRSDLALLGSGFMTPGVQGCFGPTLTMLLRAMRYLINALEQNFDLGMGMSDINGSHFLVLEHELLVFYSNSAKLATFDSNVEECCCLASLLYFNLCLWNWPRSSSLIKNISGRLRQALTTWTSTLRDSEQFPLVLWINFIGSFAASNAGDLRWYFDGISATAKAIGIKTEAELHSIVSTFFYVDRLLEQYLNMCYRDILGTLEGKGIFDNIG